MIESDHEYWIECAKWNIFSNDVLQWANTYTQVLGHGIEKKGSVGTWFSIELAASFQQ